jgi:hypothetical protein
MIAIVAALSIQELDKQIDQIGVLEGVERTMSSIILSTCMTAERDPDSSGRSSLNRTAT